MSILEILFRLWIVLVALGILRAGYRIWADRLNNPTRVAVQGLSIIRLVNGRTATAGQAPKYGPSSAQLSRLEELFQRLDSIPDTCTTCSQDSKAIIRRRLQHDLAVAANGVFAFLDIESRCPPV